MNIQGDLEVGGHAFQALGTIVFERHEWVTVQQQLLHQLPALKGAGDMHVICDMSLSYGAGARCRNCRMCHNLQCMLAAVHQSSCTELADVRLVVSGTQDVSIERSPHARIQQDFWNQELSPDSPPELLTQCLRPNTKNAAIG